MPVGFARSTVSKSAAPGSQGRGFESGSSLNIFQVFSFFSQVKGGIEATCSLILKAGMGTMRSLLRQE